VMFLVVGPWDDRWAEIEPGDGSEPGADDSIIVVSGGSSRTLAGFEVVIALALALVVVGIAIGAMLLAIRSLRRGEGDRRTASRLALFVVVSTFLASTLGGHLTGSWLLVPVRRLPYALLDGALIWLAYIGLEPYARRFWPHALVSWSRFVRARWADALVGRDVLLGCASACVLIAAGALLVAGDPAKLELGDQGALLGARFALAAVLGLPKSGLWMACIAFLAVLVTRLVLRRQWATVLATIAAPTVALAIAEPSWTMMLSGLAIGISVAFTVFRAGLLGTVAWATTFVALDTFPWTFDASAWYAGYGSIAGLVVGGLAVASFWTALGGRPLLGDGFFGK